MGHGARGFMTGAGGGQGMGMTGWGGGYFCGRKFNYFIPTLVSEKAIVENKNRKNITGAFFFFTIF